MAKCEHKFRFYQHNATCIKCKCSVMQAYNEMEQALTDSAKFITNTLGDCPFGLLGYYIDCSDDCNNSKDGECWKRYFIDNVNKYEEEID